MSISSPAVYSSLPETSAHVAGLPLRMWTLPPSAKKTNRQSPRDDDAGAAPASPSPDEKTSNIPAPVPDGKPFNPFAAMYAPGANESKSRSGIMPSPQPKPAQASIAATCLGVTALFVVVKSWAEPSATPDGKPRGVEPAKSEKLSPGLSNSPPPLGMTKQLRQKGDRAFAQTPKQKRLLPNPPTLYHKIKKKNDYSPPPKLVWGGIKGGGLLTLIPPPQPLAVVGGESKGGASNPAPQARN